MKILIGYNGSLASNAALTDIGRTGINGDDEVVLISVAERWLRPTTIEEAAEAAAHAAEILAKTHPRLRVSKMTATGDPANELLASAEMIAPNLILVGEPRANESGHGMFLGHTSQKIVNESPYSTRIAREPDGPATFSPRLLVGFDGSAAAIKAVETIAKRRWSDGTKVCLLSVADTSVLATVGRFTPQMNNATIEARLLSQWATAQASASLEMLYEAGLSAVSEVCIGNPKQAIAEYAAEWKADAIFVGPHSAPNSFTRFVIGSVSAAVAAGAGCSVEIVR